MTQPASKRLLTEAAGNATFGPKVPALDYLDAYNNFFLTPAVNTFQDGQGTSTTTLTAQATAGASTLAVTSGVSFVNGTAIITNPGTATQQQYRVTSGGGTTTLTVTPNVVTTLASGATIGPLWYNAAHLSPNGWTAFTHWFMSSSVFTDPGATRPIVWLGDSWAVSGATAFTAAVAARFPSAVVTNAGVNGDTSAQMIARFGTDVPTNAAYVIINEPGVNDVYQAVSPLVLAANLQTLVGLIRGIGAIPVVTGPVPLKEYPAASASAAAQMRTLSLPVTKVLPVLDTASADGRFAGLVSPLFVSPRPGADLSAQLLLDPGFDTGTGWTPGTGWAISGSVAAHTAGNTAALTQSWTVVSTEIYQITITITGRTAGSVTVGIGSAVSAALTATSTVAIYATGSGAQTVAVTPLTAFDGSITDISLKRITGSLAAASLGTADVRSPNITCLAIGNLAQGRLTTAGGVGNVAIGQNAQQILTDTGLNNTSVGQATHAVLRSGIGNTGIGAHAGMSLTTGSNNVHIGTDAGQLPNALVANATVTDGNQVCIGVQSGKASTALSAAIIAIGYQATAAGNYAVGVGYKAAANATESVAIGHNASTTAAGAVAIGTDSASTGASSSVQDQISLGTALHTTKILGRLVTAVGTTAKAGVNVPHGAAPTAPVDGDVWSTTAGLFIQVNGATKTVTLT